MYALGRLNRQTALSLGEGGQVRDYVCGRQAGAIFYFGHVFLKSFLRGKESKHEFIPKKNIKNQFIETDRAIVHKMWTIPLKATKVAFCAQKNCQKMLIAIQFYDIFNKYEKNG